MEEVDDDDFYASPWRSETMASESLQQPNKRLRTQEAKSSMEAARPASISCPVCAQSFADAQAAERHVNVCLDQNGDDEDQSHANENTIDPEETCKDENTANILANLHKNTVASWKSVFARVRSSVGLSTGYGCLDHRDSIAKENPPPSQYAEISVDTSTVVAVQMEETTTPFPEPQVKHSKPKRTCPFYKRIPETAFVVDAFSYGSIPNITSYFLSHFHSDHYMGLSKSFGHGIIYCSSVTANYVIQELRVDPVYVKALPMNTPCAVENATVELLEANHCPGAVLFLFTVTTPYGQRRYLHTGDFRAQPFHVDALKNIALDCVYLDTTYCQPQHVFPQQQDVLTEVVRLCKWVLVKQCTGKEMSLKWLVDWKRSAVKQTKGTGKRKANSEPPKGNMSILSWLKSSHNAAISPRPTTPNKQNNSHVHLASLSHMESQFQMAMTKNSQTLFLVGTYTIGKERVFMAIAEALDCKIYAPHRKTRLLLMQENPELTSRLIDDPWNTCLHVIRIGDLGLDNLKKYLAAFAPRYTQLLAFRPTGWVKVPDNVQPSLAHVSLTGTNDTQSICVFGVPYSEHSSFSELGQFVRGIQVRKVIPTVNVGQERSRKEMEAHFQQWLKRE